MGASDGNESSLLIGLTGLHDPGATASFLEVAFDAVVTFDHQEHIISWNPAAEKMFGWTAQEALGKTPAELFWPRDVPINHEDREQRQAKLRRGETLQGELFPCRKDGSSFPAQFTARAILDLDGKFSGFLAVYRDVSDQVQAREKEELLQKSNQRLNQILGSIQDDFYVLNRDWVFVFASRTFTSRIGKEPDDFVGKNIWEMFPKHIGGVLYENFHIAMENREIRRFEIPGRYTDAWYRMSAYPSEEGITVIGTDISDRRRTEQALQENQATLQSFYDSAPFLMGIAELEGDRTIAVSGNRAIAQFFNTQPDDLPGKTGLELGNPEAFERLWIENYRRSQKNGAPVQFEYELRRTSGSFWLHITVAFIGIGSSGNPRFSFVAEDITERKKAEQALRESENRYRHLVKYAPAGIYGIDLKTMHFTEVNDTMCKILGYTREELQSILPEDLLEEEGKKHFKQRIVRSLSGEKIPEQVEYRIRTRDGHQLWALLNTTIELDHGKPKSISVIAHDITERKQAEEALAQAMQELRAHIENSPLAIVAFDNEFRILEWSPSAQRIFGWSAEEVLGKGITEFRWVYEEDAPRVASLSADMLAGRSSSNVHVNRNYCKDGSIIECEWYNSALLDAKGQLISVRSQVLDVTQRRRAENALRESEKQLQMLNESLEQQVQEKTAEVRRLAADLVIAVQRERHRVSHILHDDLQQRIYAIQMQLTFLHHELEKVHESAHNEISEIEKQLADALEITRNLSIDLSPPILQDEGLAQAISWLAGQMKQRYGLPIDIQAEGSFILPDEELQVLLFNCVRELLFNVVKHAEAGRAVVALQWLNDSLQIEVRDNGKGFPVEMEEQQPAEEMSDEENLQVSYGLPTLRHQLSLFGGQMEISSKSGEGTDITLNVPIVKTV